MFRSNGDDAVTVIDLTVTVTWTWKTGGAVYRFNINRQFLVQMTVFPVLGLPARR